MTDLQKTLDAAISQSTIPGAVAAIGNIEGVMASAATGLADTASGKPMALDSIFQIASMTKAMTSVAAMQLVENGALTLDDPIGSIMPQLSRPQILTGFADDGTAKTQPAKNAITLRHLLTHTAGFGYPFTSADMAKAQGSVAPASLAGLNTPLMFEPGSDWLYGISTDWVGRAIEAASGQSLDAYMTDHIFEPLGMADTAFVVPPEKIDRRVSLYSKSEDQFTPFPVEIGGGEAAEFLSGGGGLYSTALDYMRFMQMILGRGKLGDTQVLSEQSVMAMSSNQIGNLRAGRMVSSIPIFANDFDPFPNMQSEWGLGFLINPTPGPDGRAAGSLTWAGIANCYYWIDPINEIAGLAMMQFLPFGDAHALDVLSAVERACYEGP